MDFLYQNELEYLKKSAADLGIKIEDEKISKFDILTKTLLKWNEVINLTAIRNPADIMIKHYLDSIAPIAHNLIPENATVIDIGCGAGFPGIPLKILSPDIKLTMLESINKKTKFIISCLEELNIDDVNVICGRAEEISHNKTHREQYDIAVSRAVADLSVLCEYCVPFVKIGGLFLAYKGENCGDELNAAKNAISELGGEIEKVYEIKLPNTISAHKIIAIRKISLTKAQYPRKQAKISKAPL